ncbi:hypothetical protein GCM10023086_26570 [Streptomyces venetus]|uniref:Uncharacterized protein n=1 Tax=Streptomyces venetus TaxID=1701086 RepID=A0ABP8FNN2_9ACTN
MPARPGRVTVTDVPEKIQWNTESSGRTTGVTWKEVAKNSRADPGDDRPLRSGRSRLRPPAPVPADPGYVCRSEAGQT